MKEDILEQMVEDWLLGMPATFTKNNVKFKPSKSHIHHKSHSDAIPSDIDVLAVHLNKTGMQRVKVVSCKSYQGGFNPEHWCNLLTRDLDKPVGGRAAWKHHRELCDSKWGEAFAQKIYDETGSQHFTYILAVTKLEGNNIALWKHRFEKEETFLNNLRLTPNAQVRIKIVSVPFMLWMLRRRMKGTIESTQFGRLIQVLKAAGDIV